MHRDGKKNVVCVCAHVGACVGEREKVGERENWMSVCGKGNFRPDVCVCPGHVVDGWFEAM